MGLKQHTEQVIQDHIENNGSLSLVDGKQVNFFNGKKSKEKFITHLQKLQSDEPLGFSTGLKEIDIETGGFQRGSYWVIGGMSSVGKTALTLQMVLNAMREGAHVMFFSMEMTLESMVARAVSHRGQIPLSYLTVAKRFQKVNQSDSDVWYEKKNGVSIAQSIKDCLKEIEQANPIFIDDPYLNIDQILEFCENYHKNVRPIDIIVPDYLQLIHSTNTDSREREVANVSNAFKKMALSMNNTVVTPVQLNENQEVRESRVIEQDCRVLLKIKVDQEEFRKSGEKKVVGIQIAKNSNGERGKMLDIKLDGAFQTFRA